MPVRYYQGVVPNTGTIAASIYFEFDYLGQKIGVINNWDFFDVYYSIEDVERFAKQNDLNIFISDEILDIGNLHDYMDLIKVLSGYNTHFILASFRQEIFKYVDPRRVFQYPWFHKGFGRYQHSKNFKRNLNYTDKEFNFNMLLGKEKSYRDIIYRVLGNNEKVYSTYLRDVNTCEVVKDEDLQVSAPYSHIIPEDIYNKTHFDIVSESQPTLPEAFLTEKTGKALYSGRFFVPYASSELLNYLMSNGYRMDSYFKYLNYSTDSDSITRLAKFFDTIDEINTSPTLIKEIYQKTAKDREFNMNHIVQEQMGFLNTLEYYLKKWIINPDSNLI